MSDVDVCKCGHHQAAHGWSKAMGGGCQRWRCNCTDYESAYCPKYVAPVPRESKG